MKIKTVLFGIGAIAVFAALMIGIRSVSAASISPRNILKSISIIGTGLVTTADSMKFALIDGSTSSSNQSLTLPTITGNDGMVYNVRYINDGALYATIVPQTGQKIEGQTNYTWYLGAGAGDETVTFVADSGTGSWWVMNQTPYIWNTTP